jgi:hypothetical protein
MHLDVGKFERVKCQVEAQLHIAYSGLTRSDTQLPIDISSIGVMDDFEYEPFVTMCVDDRLELLRMLAIIFVAQYCDNTWRIGLERGIFGPNPGAIIFDGEDGETYSLLDSYVSPFWKVRFWK